MRALCWFYQGKYKETKQGFDDYQKQYPKGAFLPDVRYRQAIIKYGLNPPEIAECQKICQDWLKDYATSGTPEVQNQIPRNPYSDWRLRNTSKHSTSIIRYALPIIISKLTASLQLRKNIFRKKTN
jgi:hypothetical protein